MAKIGFKATIVVQVRPIGDHLDVAYDEPHVNNEDDVSGARQREARIRHGSAALRHLAGGVCRSCAAVGSPAWRRGVTGRSLLCEPQRQPARGSRSLP
jgi:hypothetical protein